MTQYVGKLAMLNFFAIMWALLLGWTGGNTWGAILILFISLVIAFLAWAAEQVRERNEAIERERDALRRLSRPSTKSTNYVGPA